MTEAQLYEALGRKTVQLDRLHLEYARLLALLGQVCTGDIDPARVRIDLAQQRWTLLGVPEAAEGAVPAETPAPTPAE